MRRRVRARAAPSGWSRSSSRIARRVVCSRDAAVPADRTLIERRRPHDRERRPGEPGDPTRVEVGIAFGFERHRPSKREGFGEGSGRNGRRLRKAAPPVYARVFARTLAHADEDAQTAGADHTPAVTGPGVRMRTAVRADDASSATRMQQTATLVGCPSGGVSSAAMRSRLARTSRNRA